jgi:catechol 2,3-dioxygenase-like lactoylglutathione lyase family enzyme
VGAPGLISARQEVRDVPGPVEAPTTGTSLKLLVLKTRELDRLRNFYRLLGISFVPEQHGTGPLHYAGLVGGVVLELYPLPPGTAADEGLPRMGFSVADLAATLRLLESAGATVVSRPRQTEWELRAVVRDPDGRAVELYENR